MKLLFRGHSAAMLLLMSLAPPLALVAQENGIIPTSKILFISREYTKPGKDGTPHQLTEAAYLRAEAASKNAPHYCARVLCPGRRAPCSCMRTPPLPPWNQSTRA